MTGHDDANDDASLEPLRAAWRSLPDEDPPERGLAQLMAAARVKAEEMSAAAEPSLWERFIALMRRPQVLALATIMILIGGAVVISQRQDTRQATSEVETHDERFTPVSATTEAAGGADTIGGADRPPAAEPAAVPPAQVEEGKEAEASARERAKADARITSPKDAVTSRAMPKKPARKAATGALNLDDDFSSKGGKAEAAAPPTNAPSAGAAAEPTGATSSLPQTAPELSVKQLHEQMRAAAARNDCTTARSVAKQIARRDAPYYRANIATDPSLAVCLN